MRTPCAEVHRQAEGQLSQKNRELSDANELLKDARARTAAEIGNSTRTANTLAAQLLEDGKYEQVVTLKGPTDCVAGAVTFRCIIQNCVVVSTRSYQVSS